MSQRFSIGPVELRGNPHQHSSSNRQDDGTPYRIIVLGDFGADGKDRPRLGQPVRVDLDNLETVFAQFSARMEIPWMGSSQVLSPRSLADLHPDQLFQLPCFNVWRELRARLADANSFHAALSGLQGLTPDAGQPRADAPTSSPGQKESNDDMIQRLMGRPRRANSDPAETPTVQALLREAVAPNLAKVAASEQAAALATLDRAISGRMKDLLHHPLFQALESAWRGVDFMVRQIELDDSIELHLCDLPADRLRALALNKSLGPMLAAPFAQRGGCALIVGLYSFGTGSEDSQVLGAIADAAQTLGAPFITAAAPGLIEQLRDPEFTFSVEWQQLREQPSARLLALVAPRFLLRLPYGPKSDPIESLAFEEMPVAVAGNYLWGNPALIAGVLLAQSFAQSGWEMQGDEVTELSGLPQHAYREDGEGKLTPCAEHWLGEAEVERLAAQGISSLIALRGSDTVRLGLRPVGRGNAA